MFEGISLCFDSCDMYLLNMQSRNFILHAVPEAMSCFVGGIDQRKEIKKKHDFVKKIPCPSFIIWYETLFGSV